MIKAFKDGIMMRRCSWCKSIQFLNDDPKDQYQWFQYVNTPLEELIKNYPPTDGICPECFEEKKEEIRKFRGGSR